VKCRKIDIWRNQKPRNDIKDTFYHIIFCSSMGFGDKGHEAENVAFLSALDEEHRRLDKIEGGEL
jgi:hypothetical protein